MSTFIPKKIAHYYSWPSGVNGAAGNIPTAAAVFGVYDVVVFGAGLEEPTHGDHANTIAIIADPQMAATEVYGYIDTVQPLVDIQDKIDKWYAMGVKGIFLDKFGYDWDNTRDHQNAVVWCIHEKGIGLKAYVNAWNPDDVFGSIVDPAKNPLGVAPRIAAGDSYLLESYQIVAGAYQSKFDWRGRSDKVATYKLTFPGVDMIGLTTNADVAFDQAKMDYAYLSAIMDELDGFGWGDYNFGTSGLAMDTLVYRTRVPVYGTKNVGPIVNTGDVYERPQNVGIHIDTANNTFSLLLD